MKLRSSPWFTGPRVAPMNDRGETGRDRVSIHPVVCRSDDIWQNKVATVGIQEYVSIGRKPKCERLGEEGAC